MRSVIPMKAAKAGYIILSVVLCAAGVLCVVWPEISASVLGILCGAVLILFGIVRIVGFFSRDLYRLAFQYDFAIGVMMILLGVVMLLRPEGLMDFICVALGVYALVGSLFKIQMAVDSKRFGLSSWWLILLLAGVTGAFGGVLVFRPGAGAPALTILLGVSLFTEGLLNLSTALTAVKIVRNQQPDVIETIYVEKED